MPSYVFTGAYQTNVGLPDGSVRLTEVGETVDLDFDDPGPLWVGARTAVGKAAKSAADALAVLRAAAEAAKIPDAAPEPEPEAEAAPEAPDAAPEAPPEPATPAT
jgi:hypothetical protein